MKRIALLSVLPTLIAYAQPSSPEAQRIERLTSVGKLWGQVKVLHPRLANGTVDWDQALLSALPRLREARTPDEFQNAVECLLRPLKDPATRLAGGQQAPWVTRPEKQPNVEWLPGKTLLLHLQDYDARYELLDSPAMDEITAALKTAKAIVFDLRPSRNMGLPEDPLMGRLAPHLTDQPLVLPTLRYRQHSGYRAQVGDTYGGYASSLVMDEASRIEPAKDVHPVPVAFVVNNRSVLPPVAMELQRLGKALVIAEGALPPDADAMVKTFPMTDGRTVQFRVADRVFVDGSIGVHPDAVVPTDVRIGNSSAGIRAALDMLAGGKMPAPRKPGVIPAPVPVEIRDAPYSETPFPGLDRRILGAYRFWNAIDSFYPYKELLDHPWDEALPAFIRSMESATDAKTYTEAILAMAAQVPDNHSYVNSETLRAMRGTAEAPFRVQWIEGRPVVSHLTDEAESAKAGIHLGDILLAVNGEPVAAWMARNTPFVAASNPWTLHRNLLNLMLRAADGAELKLRFQDHTGGTRQAQVTCAAKYCATPERRGDVVRILPDNIGYIDLDRLQMTEIEKALERVKDTKALIFDMRGYPKGTAWGIAPWLAGKAPRPWAQFRRSLVNGKDGQAWYGFTDSVPPKEDPTKPGYSGKVVMLIDERTQSQAEHTGLGFEAATQITFVGSPTAGANGDITTVILPGGVTVGFTGHDVRHGDGRQLQRVGLQPHVAVTPTIAGIRAGRDEVLERAMDLLKNKE